MPWCCGEYILHWGCIIRADSRLAPSQSETSLQSNAVSQWPGAILESALYTMRDRNVTMIWPFTYQPRLGLKYLNIGWNRIWNIVTIFDPCGPYGFNSIFLLQSLYIIVLVIWYQTPSYGYLSADMDGIGTAMAQAKRWCAFCPVHHFADNVTTSCCPLVRGIHWSPVDSPHKGTITQSFYAYLFSVWTNC